MAYRTLIPFDTVARHLDDPGWVIVDCRFRLDDPEAGRQLYLASHIPGAAYADLNKDLSGPPGGDAGRHPLPPIDFFRARLGEWGITSGIQVVCYDDVGGAFAARLWWMLRYLNHETVAVLDGGWQAWLAQGQPTAGGEEQHRPVDFEGEVRPEMLAPLEEVADLPDHSLLIDSRDEARYRGEMEPVDPVAGHIPGALNRPFRHNLGDRSIMRPPEELEQVWQGILQGRAAADCVVYCGSGVTACHNILSLEHCGLHGARLFVPSWSGWSADPRRPIEQG